MLGDQIPYDDDERSAQFNNQGCRAHLASFEVYSKE